MINKETIDKIFDVAIIEEVVGEFVELKKSGTSFKGLSPFTSEKTPSFYVVPHKGIYKCFSSGKGGNVVSFLMEQEKLSYPEALRWLAAKYNIEIEEEEQTEEQKQQQTDRESLSILHEYAQKYFSETMNETGEGKSIGLSYFRERGFTDQTIDKFLLGYCLDQRDSFTKTALEKEYQLKYLLKSGLTKESKGAPFDFFKGRVIFPIRNISGKTIAFGARTLKSDKKVAKYYNSPESELYVKSNTLYGLYLAKKSIVQNNNCYIVEGYTDVISLHQSGVENVVASAGTSLTQNQIKKIKRYTTNITILFDGDKAGIRASFRGIDMILSEGMNVRIVMFPDGADPDSYARSVSTPVLHEYLKEEAKDFIVFKSDVLKQDAKDDPIKRSEMVRDVVSTIALIPDAIQREIYTKETSRLLEVEEVTLITEINKILRKNLNKSNKQSSAPSSYQEIPPLPGEVVAPQIKQGSLDENLDAYHQELDLVRLLFQHGTKIIPFKYQVQIAENKLVDTEIHMTVSEFLIEELRKDELKLLNKNLAGIVNEYEKHIFNGSFPDPSYFAKQEDLEVSKIYTDLSMSPYELSDNWRLKHKIYPQVEEEKLRHAVESSIFRYKIHVIDRYSRIILSKIEQAEKDGDDQRIEKLLFNKTKLDRARRNYTQFFEASKINT